MGKTNAVSKPQENIRKLRAKLISAWLALCVIVILALKGLLLMGHGAILLANKLRADVVVSIAQAEIAHSDKTISASLSRIAEEATLSREATQSLEVQIYGLRLDLEEMRAREIAKEHKWKI